MPNDLELCGVPVGTGGRVFLSEHARWEPEGIRFLAIPHELPVTASLNEPYEHLLMRILIGSTLLAGTSVAYPLVTRMAEFAPGGIGAIELAAATPTPRLTQASFASRLQEMLDEAAVEPGDVHPAESLLSLASEDPSFGRWLEGLLGRSDRYLASIVLLVGRLPLGALPEASVRSVLDRALQDARVAVREAGVRAAETLGAVGLAALRQHRETAPWLASYMKQVVEDLESRK